MAKNKNIDPSGNSSSRFEDNLLYKRLTRLGSFKTSVIEHKTEVVPGQLKPVLITSFLKSKDYLVREYSTNIDEAYKETLMEYLSVPAVRSEVYSVISDRDQLINIFNEAACSKNGYVRPNSAMSNYIIIQKAVDTLGLSHQSTIVLSIMITLAFKQWGLLGANTPIVSFNVLDKVKTDQKQVIIEMQKSNARLIVEQIHFFSLSAFLSDRIASVSIQSMVDTFINSLATFRVMLQNMRKTDEALESVLPRIKAFITDQIEHNYKDVGEKGFIEDPVFRELASNVDLIRMAMEQSELRPLTPPYLWREHDSILKEALRSSPLIDFVDIAGMSKSYTFTKVRNSLNKVKYIVATRNLKSDCIVDSFYETKCGEYSEYDAFDRLGGIVNTVSAWANTITSVDLHNLVVSVISSIVGKDSKTYMVELGLDDNDIEMLALGLCKSVSWSNSANKFVYHVSATDYSDVTDMVDGIVTDFSTTDPKLALACVVNDTIGSDWISYGQNLTLKRGHRYSKIDLYLNKDFKTSLPLNIAFKESFSSPDLYVYSEDISIAELFRLDLGYNIISLLPVSALPIVALLRSTFRELYKHVKTEYVDDSVVNSNDNIERFISLHLARFIGQRFDKLKDNMVVNSLVQSIKYRMRSNPTLLSAKLSDGAFYANKLVSNLVSVGMVIFLMERFGFIESYEDFEDVNKYLTLYYSELT